MAEITAHSSLQQVAAIVSQALVAHGVEATLSGGAAAVVPEQIRVGRGRVLAHPPQNTHMLQLASRKQEAVGITMLN
jgi:hypothetical protein